MKRKITLQYSLIMVLAVIAFIVGASLIARSNLNNITEHNLTQYLSIISGDYVAYDDSQALIDAYATLEDSIRITILNPEGNVTFDSSGNPLDNHLTRPEFVDLGVAYSRYSDTVEQTMMYMAKSMSDGGFLRVAIPIDSILPFLNDFIVFSIIIGILIILLASILVHFATQKTLQPLKDTVASLNAVARGEYIERLPLEQTEEMNHIINDINQISRMISDNINALFVEKQKIDFILNHMDQGLCVLDANMKVVLVNKFIENLFQYQPATNLNKDYLYLFRNPGIQKIINDLASGEDGLVTYFSEGDKEYSVAGNRMVTTWSQSKLYLLIFNDITAIKQVETLKRDFFVNASHELKSPLTSIIGASELISSDIVSKPEEIQDLAHRILQEAGRMNNLVADMLNLSQYENNIMTKNETMVDLSLVVSDIKNSLEHLALTKKIELITYLEPIVFFADYEHMVQLVRNLMDNAIQYGVENGHVTVKLYRLGENIKLEVIDDGIGIPKADQARVFERFYRVDKARSKKTGGTGLGLSIVKHVCALYHAQISLESEPNKGTKVTITIPDKKPSK